MIGLGANLGGPWGTPRQTLAAALARLASDGVAVSRRSRWYRSAPVPPAAQPWFVNAVAIVETDRDAAALLDLLHAVEAAGGRRRGRRWAARALDLDLLDYHGTVSAGGRSAPILPHPRLHQRAFVLRPLAEIAPGWRHPVLRRSAGALLARLPAGQRTVPFGPREPWR